MFINLWHSALAMRRHDRSWHEQDIQEELREYLEARGLLHRWSELSDVVYTQTLAKWDGHHFDFPLSSWLFPVGAVYMFPKYSLRWLFFRVAGKRLGASSPVHAVRNPRKEQKLMKIAEANKLDPEKFLAVCKSQRKYWPLLP